jgi:membrane protein
MFRKIFQFLNTDIWNLKIRNAKGLSRLHATGIILLRIIVLSIKDFFRDKCQLRAAAMTLYTLLAMIPIAAMSIGLAKGFGLEKLLENEIMEKLASQKEVAEKLITYSKTFLETTKGGVVAGIGVFILFWTVIGVISNIESSFNDVWGVRNQRPFFRKITDYLAIVLICPFLFIAASSLNVYINVYITSKLLDITKNVELLSMVSGPIFSLLKLTPYFLLWIAFSFVYMFLPNTKVKVSPAVTGGLITATFYLTMQWLYLHFQVGVTQYNAVYGSLAALPLFLIWLQMSWMIVLFGAEICFALQNHEQFEYDIDPNEISYSLKELLALRVSLACVENFCKSATPWSAEELADNLEIPIKILKEILFELKECGILSQVCNTEDDRFQPAKDVNIMTVTFLLSAYRSHAKKILPEPKDKNTQQLKNLMEKFGETLGRSKENVLLKDLIVLENPVK